MDSSHPLIAPGILWKSLLLQSSCAPVLYCLIHHRKHWNGADHSNDPKQGTENQDRKEDPETSQSNGAAYDLRTYDIAIHLKYNDDQNDKNDPLDRIHQKDQKGTRNSSDVLSKKRDYMPCKAYPQYSGQ